MALEIKFQERHDSLFRQREGIVKGEVYVALPNKNEEEGEDEGEEEEEDLPPLEEEEEDEEDGVPSFWLQAMIHHPVISEIIEKDDIEALEHLTSVACVVSEDLTSFTLVFSFSSNPFFPHPSLTKSYSMVNLLDAEQQRMVVGATGFEIEWGEGKDLTSKLVKKKQRAKTGKKAGQVRVVHKTVEKESFFNFFKVPRILNTPESDNVEAEEVLEKELEEDVEISECFRTQLIPNAFIWFTGEVFQGFEGDDDDDDVGEGFLVEEMEGVGLGQEGEDEEALVEGETGDENGGGLKRSKANNTLPTVNNGEDGETPECNQS